MPMCRTVGFGDPILSTKLISPSIRSELVPRPRLLAHMDLGLSKALTLVSAPAGFGKSTLVGAWARNSKKGARFTWLNLDDDDNDLNRFFVYFVAALQSIESEIGQSILPVLQSPSRLSINNVLTTLINEIREYSGKIVIILDDYHTISSSSIDRALAFLLDHLPGNLRIVISTRMDPSLPLSRLRSHDAIAEVRAEDLRFTTEEAMTFLHNIMNLDLSSHDVATLEKQTEGWITGLQLAALSMKSCKDPAQFVRSFDSSNRYILDYLSDEVFSSQTAEIQEFLLGTSILRRLSGPLCDAILQYGDGERTLQDLEQGNLFIISLDNDRRWYRYHHLFASLLEHRLRQYQPKSLSTLHMRACDWYAHHGFTSEAVYHALSGQDFARAAELIQSCGLSLIGEGSFTTVLRWIDAFPNEYVSDHAFLNILRVWASVFSMKTPDIEPYLYSAEIAVDRFEEQKREYRISEIAGHISAIKGWAARRRRDNQLAIRHFKDAEANIDTCDSFLYAFVTLNRGLAYLDEGVLDDAIHYLKKLANTVHFELFKLVAAGYLAAALNLQGRLREAAELCRHTIADQYKKRAKPSPAICMVHIRLGDILAEWNDIDGFYQQLSQGVLLADQIGYESVVIAGLKSMVWEMQLLKEQGHSIELPHEIIEIVERALPGATCASGDIQTRGDIPDMASLNSGYPEHYLADETFFEVNPGYSKLARALKLSAEGRNEDALSHLARLYETARTYGGTGLMIQARTTEALVRRTQNDFDGAVDALCDALEMSEPEGYVRTYADRGMPMYELLREVASRGFSSEYTESLISAFSGGSNPESDSPPQPLVEPLSSREMEVLELISEGLSNIEIGDRLFLALSSVKGHNQNIYRKLQVRRRTEAVARARELELL